MPENRFEVIALTAAVVAAVGLLLIAVSVSVYG